MAASKDPSAYPVAFRLLLDHFADPLAAPVEQYFASLAEATRTRFTFYNYKRALRLSGDAQGFAASGAILVVLRPHRSGGATLIFSARDNVEFAVNLEAAILAAQGPATPSASVPADPPSRREETSDEAVTRYLNP